MDDRQLNGVSGKGIGQNRNKGAALVTVEHRLDDVPTIGAQHAAVIAHRFAGDPLNQPVERA